jgi:protein-disulfide isomerase
MQKKFVRAGTALVLFLAALVALPFGLRAQDGFSAREKGDIEAIVKDYLMENPEVLIDALRLYQKRAEAAQKAQQAHSLKSSRDELLHDPDSPIGGNASGDVSVVEFFDYQCGYCKRAFPDTKRLVKDDSGVRFVYKEFPILGPASLIAARVALAARKQGKYVAFHDALMSARGRLDEARILSIARGAGLDVAQLKKDMADPEIDRIIARNKALARKLGVTGTPGFVIGDAVVPGAISLEQMKSLVAEARSACKDC